jgi:hypothetical protein
MSFADLAARPDAAAISNFLTENLLGNLVWTERGMNLMIESDGRQVDAALWE